MNQFVNSLRNTYNQKETENGAFALKSTNSSLIDLFGTIGALRTRSDSDVISSFIKAYADNSLLALKMLFYARDIREGLGERRVFKVIAKYLADNHTENMRLNLGLVSEYGRFDDYYAFVGTALEKDAFAILKAQYEKDLKSLEKGEHVSLLGKWLKSENTSSKESQELARITMKYFHPNCKSRNRIYRKNLSALRKAIDVVEVSMSTNKWGEIDYPAVPSKAALNYREAFRKHDEERYDSFLSAVAKGETKINAKALFPYDIVRGYYGKLNQTKEEQWKALPNYVTDDKNFLIMADVSGSMSGTPMDVSTSLGIYFADRTKGAFKGQVMTFSERPSLVSIPENMSLIDKLNLIRSMDWGGSTDLEAAFDLVLKSAIKGNVPKEDMPDALVVITDMEINDYAMDELDINFTKTMKEKFQAAGYEMPTLVWWNVNARENTFHGEYNDKSCRFISGASATVFKSLCENMGETPEDLMLRTLNSERYAAIKIVD